MRIFGLPLSGPDAVEAEITHELGSATLMADGYPPVVIKHSMIPEEPYSLDRFQVFPCFTGRSLPAEVMHLRMRRDSARNTVGYVFPTTSFRNELEFEDEYLLKYADAAFRGGVEISTLAEYQSNRLWSELSAAPAHLDEVLHESLSLVAISREVLQDYEVDNALLDLILRRESISICSSRSALTSSPRVEGVRDEINLEKPVSDFGDDLLVLGALLKSADQDNSEIGKFIQLYQYLEFVLRKVFEWGIPEAAIVGISPWDTKERLTKLAGEKHRLHLVETVCLPSLSDRGGMDSLVEVSREFLDMLGIEYKPNREWHRLLYLVRNSVVHDQFAMLKLGCTDKLKDVNTALRKVVLDVLFHFEKPKTGSFFQ